MSQFQVILNPQNFLMKHEVWYKGKAETHDARGYLVEADVCKPIKSFRTDSQAKAFIKYQQDVRAFKGL